MRVKMFITAVAAVAAIGVTWAAGNRPAASTTEGLYCPMVDTTFESCCCKVVDGKFVCQVTGAVSDTCCCE